MDQSKTTPSQIPMSGLRRLAVALAITAAPLLMTGCSATRGVSMASMNPFSWNREPSAETLAGSGPTKTYGMPTSPSQQATPQAIDSIAAGTGSDAGFTVSDGTASSPGANASPYGRVAAAGYGTQPYGADATGNSTNAPYNAATYSAPPVANPNLAANANGYAAQASTYPTNMPGSAGAGPSSNLATNNPGGYAASANTSVPSTSLANGSTLASGNGLNAYQQIAAGASSSPGTGLSDVSVPPMGQTPNYQPPAGIDMPPSLVANSNPAAPGAFSIPEASSPATSPATSPSGNAFAMPPFGATAAAAAINETPATGIAMTSPPSNTMPGIGETPNTMPGITPGIGLSPSTSDPPGMPAVGGPAARTAANTPPTAAAASPGLSLPPPSASPSATAPSATAGGYRPGSLSGSGGYPGSYPAPTGTLQR